MPTFKKPLQLVKLLAYAQLICLCSGLFVFTSWMSRAIRTTVHEQTLADNILVAQQLTKMVREMGIGDVRTDVAQWERMQNVVRDVRLPNSGYVCLVDSASGGLICHPALRSPPTMAAKPPMGKKWMNTQPADKAGHAAEAAVTGAILGEGDALEVVAAAEIPAWNARLLVHQLGAGIDRRVAGVTNSVALIGLAVVVGVVGSTTAALFLVVRRYDDRLRRINGQLERRVEQRTRALRKTRDAVIFGLAKLAESRDTDTGEHLERIRTYSNLLAEQMQRDGIDLDHKLVRNLGLASSLHDIGKVGVADRVLLKPGRLDPEERAEMQTHAARGGDCLAAIGERLGEDDFLQLAKEIAYAHHEKWDGTGYPAGLSGEGIPIAARIVAVADVYDALRSRRPYKESMPHAKARSILLEGSGGHFDPVVIEAFVACEQEFVALSERSNTASGRDHATDESPVLAAST